MRRFLTRYLAYSGQPQGFLPKPTLGWGAAASIALLLALAAQAAGPDAAIAAGLALFMAGLPHGVFGVVGSFLMTRPGYILRYLALGAVAALAFLAAPILILVLFLALSAWHFGHEPVAGTRLRRVAIACLAIGGSALWRPGETAAVFAALCGTAVPNALTFSLAIIGALGTLAAFGQLLRRPIDAAMLVILISPVLLHPVLATGAVFMLGHAGPVSVGIMRNQGWSWLPVGAIVLISLVLAGGAVFVLPLPSAHLPYAAAAALAVIIPHLLPQGWLSPAHVRRAPDQSSQAATSLAT